MSLANQPAFPHFDEIETWAGDGKAVTLQMPRGGLTTRQYFAGLAMQGLLANSYTAAVPPSGLALKAVLVADALIVALTPKLEKP